jgi:AcrR family transcriptional regulator
MLILLTSGVTYIMEEKFTQDSVRSRLLFSGLKELEQHGVSDFSLRRVAQDAGVSCAAPYRHFKDKDELISAVTGFVLEGWTLLSRQICEIFASDSSLLVTELAVAGLRFWIANGNFRTVIMATSTMSGTERGPIEEFDRPIVDAVRAYAEERGIADSERMTFKLLSMLYGAVILVDEGYESADKAADNLRAILSNGL